MIRLLLRDDQWERIQDLLPGKASDRGVTAKDNRLFVEAVLWIARAGAPWRDLPDEFGLWNPVYQRFSRAAKRGVWQRVFEVLASDADFEEVYLDSSVVRAHQHAAGAQKRRQSSDRALARRPDDPDSRLWSRGWAISPLGS